MKELEDAIDMSLDAELGDEVIVSIPLGQFRHLMDMYRRTCAIAEALVNGARQVSACATDFSKWADGLEIIK